MVVRDGVICDSGLVTRQVDKPRRGVLPTSTHLRLLTVHRSNTWWRVVPKKMAAVAETSTATWTKDAFC